jgi:hypothetical protein
MVAVPP